MTGTQPTDTAPASIGQSIQEQRIRILFEDASVLFYASNIPFGLFYAFIFCGLVPDIGIAPVEVGAMWFSAVLAQSLLGMFAAQLYQRRNKALSNRNWVLLLSFIWAASGVIWGALTWIMWQPENPVNQALLIVIVLGAEVIIFFCIAASFTVLCAGLLPLAVLSFAKFITAGGTLAGIVGVAAPLFTMLLLFFGYKTAERYRQVFELQQANADLAHRFEEERDKAEEASNAKSEFLATMSHEIRTPMNGVLGFASLLNNSTLDETQRDYVNSIKDSGDTLLNIINDILDISKIEAGALILDEETFSLRSVIESVLSLQRPKAQAKSLDLAMHIDPDLPLWFLGDSGRMRQMLMNFVGNAIKFTEQGSIAVIARPDQQASNGSDRCSVRIEIIDTGIGIAEDQIERLFDRFTQVDSSRTRRFGGTGLGLAICKELATAMGGAVAAESELGVGSTFSVSIPFAVARQRDDRSPTEDLVDLDGRRILVADDIALNRRIFELMLGCRGMAVTSVQDAGAAFAKAERAANEGTPFDAAIIDHMMPVTDGVELAERLKANTVTRGLPLILSSSSDLVSESEAVARGFVARAAKPIREAEIFAALQMALTAEPLRETEQRSANESMTEAPPVQTSDPGPSERKAGSRILLVEDNAVNRQLVLAALSVSNVTVDVAHDGIEAVAAVKAFPYDLVLMDIQMPNMNGIDATKRIRELPAPVNDIPIIAMTADAMTGDKERYLAAGMNDYIAKPIDLAEMIATVHQYLGLELPLDAREGAGSSETSQQTKASA